MINHEFTSKIIDKLTKDTGVDGKKLLNSSSLLEYINIKTKSANKGSKSRSSFGNLYALYVLVEDYIKNVYEQGQDYSQYEGAIFSTLFKRQRELPFGTKLQNHSLNHRLNQEYHKYFPMSEKSVVLRDVKTNRYWINVHFTETLDVKKYFLDIEKVEHYPIRFVVKTYEEENLVLSKIKNNALNQFGINKVVERYMDSIEEIITIPTLLKYFEQAINKGYLNDILNEILLQSQIEFNYDNIVSQIN